MYRLLYSYIGQPTVEVNFWRPYGVDRRILLHGSLYRAGLVPDKLNGLIVIVGIVLSRTALYRCVCTVVLQEKIMGAAGHRGRNWGRGVFTPTASDNGVLTL